MNIENLCTGCMSEKNTEGICPVCGWDEKPYDVPFYLQQRTILNSRYYLGKVIGHGGFGITYLAWDMVLNAKVAIKEYFPIGFVARSIKEASVYVHTDEFKKQFEYGLEKFLDEARTLVQFENLPGIVFVRDFFKANATAYIVMSYLEGVTLDKYLKDMGGKIHYQDAINVMLPVMDALSSVHKVGILHRDISPDNIFMTKEGQVKILDFGAARYAIGETNKSLSVILKRGYAPQEQYLSKGNQGPWTDVYALAATMYKMITGEIPEEALERMENDTLVKPSELGVEIPAHIEQALIKALAVRVADRFKSMDEFKQAILSTNVSYVSMPTDLVNATVLLEKEEPEPVLEKKKTKKPIIYTSIAAIFLIAIAITFVSLINRNNDNLAETSNISNEKDVQHDVYEAILPLEEKDEDSYTTEEELNEDNSEDEDSIENEDNIDNEDNAHSNSGVKVSSTGAKLGNSIGNFSNNGFATQYKDKIYYVRLFLKYGIFRIDFDGSNKEILLDNISYISSINVIDGYIYVLGMIRLDTGLESGIIKVSLEDRLAETLYNVNIAYISDMIIQDDWIYFKLRDETNDMRYLHKMRTDGSGLTKITEDPVANFVLADDWIFYTNDYPSNIYRIKIDGSNNSLFCEINAEKLVSDEEWLYFKEYSGNNTYISRVKIDEGQKEIIKEVDAFRFTVSGDWIYYTVKDEENIRDKWLYKMRLDGSDNVKVFEKAVDDINIAGDWIFFGSNSEHYRIKTDGTELTLLD